MTTMEICCTLVSYPKVYNQIQIRICSTKIKFSNIVLIRFSDLICMFLVPTSNHYNDDDSDTDVKVIPFKKRQMNNSEEEEVKTIKIVQDSSPVSEKVMCYICRASLMSQYLVRHMKSGHSDDYKNSENNDRDASRVLLKIRRM